MNNLIYQFNAIKLEKKVKILSMDEIPCEVEKVINTKNKVKQVSTKCIVYKCEKEAVIGSKVCWEHKLPPVQKKKNEKKIEMCLHENCEKETSSARSQYCSAHKPQRVAKSKLEKRLKK